MFIYFPLVILLVVICWYGGRLGIKAALGTIAVLWFVPAIYLFQILHLQYPPLRKALAYKEFDRELEGKKLQRLHSEWQYIDTDWFICLSRDHTAALCARWINFEKTAYFRQRTEILSSGGGVTHNFHAPLLCFVGRDGSEIIARLDCSPDVVKWVKSHGGKIHDIT